MQVRAIEGGACRTESNPFQVRQISNLPQGPVIASGQGAQRANPGSELRIGFGKIVASLEDIALIVHERVEQSISQPASDSGWRGAVQSAGESQVRGHSAKGQTRIGEMT